MIVDLDGRMKWLEKIRLANLLTTGKVIGFRRSSQKGFHLYLGYSGFEPIEDSVRRRFCHIRGFEITWNRKGNFRVGEWEKLSLERIFSLESYQNGYVPINEVKKKDVK